MGDTRRAVVEGLARAARVITAAAAIMMAVFGAFVLSGDVFLKLIGIGWSPRFSSTRPSCAWCRTGRDAAARRAQVVAAALDRALPQLELEPQGAGELSWRTPTRCDCCRVRLLRARDYFLWSTTQVL